MSKQQPAKAKKGKKDAVEARIAKVQLVVGEDKVSRDVIKRVLDAHANDVAAAANAILDGERLFFCFFFWLFFFAWLGRGTGR